MQTVATAAVRLIEPKSARVIDNLVPALFERDRLEKFVIYKDNQQVACSQSAVEID